jgi:hypothetical protein
MLYVKRGSSGNRPAQCGRRGRVVGGCRGGGNARENLGTRIRLAGPGFPGMGGQVVSEITLFWIITVLSEDSFSGE